MWDGVNRAKRGSSSPVRVFTSAGRGWDGIEIVRFTGYDEVSLPPSRKHHAIIHLNRRPLELTQRLDGRLRKERVHCGEVGIIPAGLQWEWGFRGETESDLLPICLEDSFLREVARGVDLDPDRLEIAPLLGTRNPNIERIGLSLKEEIESGGILGGKLYAESLATALAITLIRDHSSLGRTAAGKAGREHNGGLSKRALREATDYIGDNLGRELKLADIASATHMSPYHFSRLFKQSTGLTPHKYVIERRVGRAAELLGGTALPIAEISVVCGFANQSHMTRHFRHLLGVTPKTAR